MAKLQYVTLRVFRVLLSKGLCSDETEETEGDGEGDIDGMKVCALGWHGCFVCVERLVCTCFCPVLAWISVGAPVSVV